MKLRTITFNMCHGEGKDGKIDVKRQAEFLKEYQPDILFLQEIDLYTDRVNKENQIQDFSEYIGLTYNSMGTYINFKNGFYGDGILSKFPIAYSANYLMPKQKPENETRGLLCNKIPFGTTKLNLFSAHLSTCEAERIIAAKEIMKLVKRIKQDEIVIIGGDFNVGKKKIGDHLYEYEQKNTYEEYEILKENLNKVGNCEPTWSMNKYKGCIDTIFYSKSIQLKKYKTIQTDVSDHNPVFAEFEI